MSDLRVNYEQPETLFAKEIQAKMDEMGLSIRDMAALTDSTYENMRRLVRGTSLPSKFFVVAIANVLKLDVKKLQELVAADKIKHKFGKVPDILAGKNPELTPIERLWSNLTKAQKDNIIEMVRNYAKNNRQRKVAS